jgi:SRSO17 transposase
VAGAQHPAVQRLQFFLSESRWDPEQVSARRLELLLADPAAAPHGGGVLVIDDSGDRKDGARTAHVGRQWLGTGGRVAGSAAASRGARSGLHSHRRHHADQHQGNHRRPSSPRQRQH